MSEETDEPGGSRFTYSPLHSAGVPGTEDYAEPHDDIVLSRSQRPSKSRLWHRETFLLASAITYVSDLVVPAREQGQQVRTRVVVTVPPGRKPMETDLTSVPALLTWLVPKSGAHLPAALLHDGLVLDGPVKTYRAHRRDPATASRADLDIDRVDADRIFREAMASTGVGVIRRSLVWAAVTTASLWAGPRGRRQIYYNLVLAATLAAIAFLGLCATVDLLDVDPWQHRWLRWVADLPWVGRWVGELPWMPEHVLAFEALCGLAGAVVVPLPLALLWGRYAPAGYIACVALATLLHVTIAVALVAAAYQVADLAATHAPRLTAAVAAVVALAALGLFSWALWESRPW